MFEVSFTCEYHGYAILVGCFYGFLVADGSPGLDDCRDPCLVGCFHAVREGEEGIGSHDTTPYTVASLPDGVF